MAPRFHLYHGRDLNHISDLSTSIIHMSITTGLHGSASGHVTVEETPSNSSILENLRENSHMVKYSGDGTGQIYGAIVESATVNRGIWTINICGAWEYFDKFSIIASHKANDASITSPEDDFSNIKIFYSDSPIGIIHEILKNNANSMTARGYDSTLINYAALRAHITTNTNATWGRSYRLNSLETPTLKLILEDILEDSETNTISIKVSQNLETSTKFEFIFNIVNSTTAITNINEDTDGIFEISEESGESSTRSYSIATGTDLRDRSVIERVSFDASVAYSDTTITIPQERSASVKRAATSHIVSESSGEHFLNFSSFSGNYDIYQNITISSAAMGTRNGTIVEKSIEGTKYTYRLQIGAPTQMASALKKPVDSLAKLVFSPLATTTAVSKREASRKSDNTGWRA